ncbi:MFS general substrate transporter [Obba rivulosa]|uniref:MFS general substrate transporter n=1 Tax=Obba rivulosa TaxID=1052685 RepID=A0A8E2J588_9APHY|nr:MFS general substrate transporter [Obba rivulosa]
MASGYQPTDAIISSNFSIYSPEASRARPLSDAAAPLTQSSQPQSDMIDTVSRATSERDPLLGGRSKTPERKPFYRPRPLWLVPFAVVASIVRGMTLAPRVQVFTQLSCNAIYGHDVYDHTTHNYTTALGYNYSPIPLHLDLAGPRLNRLHSDLPPFALTLDESHPVVWLATQDGDDGDEPDPRSPPSKRCLEDPAVLAGAARIQTIMTTTMGALSALTTGWWGHFGERHGRTRVLAASTLGLFLTDMTFILVSTPHSAFAAHGHKLLIISPIIEGLLGGWTTLQGATSAYVSDCTSDGSRARIFSRFTGVFFLGFSMGPTIAAFLIRHPLFADSSPVSRVHNGAPTVTSVFYVAAMCSFVNFLLALFVFPESLQKKKEKADSETATVPLGREVVLSPPRKRDWFLGFLSPLALFLPKKIEVPGHPPRKDWSLTFLALAMFGYLLSTGIFQIKYLYAERIYKWGAEQLSYYISFMGLARALHLLFLMPFIISTFKPKPKLVSKPAADSSTTPAKKAKPSPAHLAKEMSFDVTLIQASLVIDLLSHTLVSLSPPDLSPLLFTGFTVLSSFGAGLVPAANSLGLCIMQANGQDETGKLFGAFAVLQAVGQMVLGPLMFGLIFSETVAKFPKAIFATAASFLVVSTAFVCMLRPDAALRARRREARLDAEVERGRSRVSKNISRASFSESSSAPGSTNTPSPGPE